MEKDKVITGYVLRKIQYFNQTAELSGTKANLAKLRRGIGKKPGSMPELWGVLFDGFPEECMGTGYEPSKEEWAVYVTLVMYALHRQGKTGDVHCSGREYSLGCAMRKLVTDEEDEKRIHRRFNTFATSEDMEELQYHLRTMIQLLSSTGDIKLDYGQLAKDLYWFQWETTRDSVRLKWGEDFYRTKKQSESEDKENE